MDPRVKPEDDEVVRSLQISSEGYSAVRPLGRTKDAVSY
jgi:hypothetical protein